MLINFLAISDPIIELIKLLGLPVEAVEGGVATMLAFAVLYLVREQLLNKKQDSQQINLQQSLTKLASDANSRSDKAITLSEESIKINKQLGRYISKHTEALDGFNSRFDALDNEVSKLPGLLGEIRSGFIKTSVTRVVIRDSNKNVIATFVARPETLRNGDQVLVVDMGKVRKINNGD